MIATCVQRDSFGPVNIRIVQTAAVPAYREARRPGSEQPDRSCLR